MQTNRSPLFVLLLQLILGQCAPHMVCETVTGPIHSLPLTNFKTAVPYVEQSDQYRRFSLRMTAQ